MESPLTRRRWLMPLVFFQLYLSTTVLLFFFGPWPWDVSNPLALTAFLVAAQLSIALGYLMAWRRVEAAAARTTATTRSQHVRLGVRFLKLCLLVTAVLAIPTSLSRTGSWWPNVAEGLANAGLVYNNNLDRLYEGNAFVGVEYLRILAAPYLVGLFPLTAAYWRQLSLTLKLGCVAAILFNVALYIATGTNKGVADVIVTLPWLIGIAGVAKLPRRRKLWVAAVLAIVFVLFLAFFGAGQKERSGSVGERGVFDTGTDIITADLGAYGDLLTDDQRVIFQSLTRYVVQGYYPLSLSLSIEHPTTWGFGHSMFLARNANALFGTTFFSEQSLPGIIENQYGWGMFTLWHSIYTWLESDVGIFGTLLVIGCFGYLLALSWGHALTTGRHHWIVLLFLMLVIFYYIPANNQVFQTGETCIAFFVVLIAALRRRTFRLRRSVRVAGRAPA